MEYKTRKNKIMLTFEIFFILRKILQRKKQNKKKIEYNFIMMNRKEKKNSNQIEYVYSKTTRLDSRPNSSFQRL